MVKCGGEGPVGTESKVRAGQTILIAWEFGGNFGHVSQIAEILPHLSRHARVVIAAQDIGAMRAFAPDFGGPILAAPKAPPLSAAPQSPGTGYADDLSRLGWSDPDNLSRQLKAWIEIFERICPDLVVTKAAPTALLAARAKGLSTCALGFGYDLPPTTRPLPAFRHWADTPKDKQDRQNREQIILASINKALTKFGLKVLAHFADGLQADRSLLLSPPAIDPYCPRSGFAAPEPLCAGPVVSLSHGAAGSWTKFEAKRVFAYLRLDSQARTPPCDMLKHLAARHEVILAAPGIPGALAQELRASGVCVIDGAIRLDGILPGCDLGISHGSNNMASCFALFRIPQICLPRHMEQVMVTRAVTESGQGVGFGPNAAARSMLAAADHFLTTERYAEMRRQRCADDVLQDLAAVPARVANHILATGREPPGTRITPPRPDR